MTYKEYKQRFRFDVERHLLGAGGFGQVFQAWDDECHCYVALKLAPVRPDEEFNLLQEYRRVRNLRHRNIANYLGCERLHFPDVGSYDVAWMQFYEAGDLHQLLSHHQLTASQKDKLLRGVLAGLKFLHTQEPFLIHRDLKPANVLIVAREGEYVPLITDFGISRQSLGNSYVTNSGRPMSLYFAAPEQDEAEELRRNTDLWSFGVLVAYVWRDGKLPFSDQGLNLSEESGKRQLRARIHRLELLPDVWAGLPEPWRKVAQVCLVTNPAQRVRSTTDLYQLLDEDTIPPLRTADDLFSKGRAAEARQDYVAARHYYQRATDLHHSEAAYTLGGLYYRGRGTPADATRARQLFEQAAAQGHAAARQQLQKMDPKPKTKRWLWVAGVVAGAVLGGVGLVTWRAPHPPDDSATVATLVAQLEQQMVPVQGGPFLFGLSPQVEHAPGWREPGGLKSRSVASFRLGSLEITASQWQQLMAAPADSARRRATPPNCPDCPATDVSLDEVKAFLAELNHRSGHRYRLPTDTEWEYAAKGGAAMPASGRYLPYAGSRSYSQTSWLSENSQGHLHPVGQLRPNALKLYDMCGNAEEWTGSDGDRMLRDSVYYGVYVRGGSYLYASTECSITFRRVAARPEQPAHGVGFRLAEDAN